MRWIYANPNDDGTRATDLGCGWFPTVPGEFANIAAPPCVILSGAGQQIILPDNDLTHAQVYKAAQPILDAEQAAQNQPAAAELAVTVDPQALTDAQTAVNNATTVAQLRKAVVAALNLLNPN